MDEPALFLKFWTNEAATTRKVIARIPEGSTYKPDPKSRTARELAWQIVREEIVLADGLATGVLEWEDVPAPATIKEVLAARDGRYDQSLAKLQGLESSDWLRPVPFTFQGQEVMKASGSDQAWGFLFDIIHHRGQLATYLRPMGSTVPQIYGPSADEP